MNRQQAFINWLANVLGDTNIHLEAMTGDAGFRHYYRIKLKNSTVIAVDAPNDKSNNEAFIAMQQSFAKQGVHVPEIIAVDRSQGFFCLSDLGHTMLADTLTPESMQSDYQNAITLLPTISKTAVVSSYQLPVFDRPFIQIELEIFNEWLIGAFLELEAQIDKAKLQHCFDLLIENALEQPQVVMHRDFHSRNIMVLNNGEYATIDFQDAVKGPITYDAVSLLRDCYVKWPDHKVELLFKQCIEQFIQADSTLGHIELKQWQRWFDLTGLQRHVKVAGIFPRLSLRDGKDGYLNDTPLVLEYIIEVSAKYPELSYLHDITERIIQPAFLQKVKGK